MLHYERGSPTDALISAERALRINPNMPGAHFGLAEALLLRGDLARGWEEYEWRFRMPGVPPLMPKNDIPQWDGKPLESGRLMLIADQGFGDGIQFARYIPWAAERCAEVVVACSQELQPLIRQIPGVAALFDRWEAAPACAAFIPLSGLPRLHGTRVETIPWPGPYLQARCRQGGSWRGAPRPAGRARASAHRPRLGRPADAQERPQPLGGAERAEAPHRSAGDHLRLAAEGSRPEPDRRLFRPRADRQPRPGARDLRRDPRRCIEGLERVVTVDTAIGHLAGASGKAAFVMLPYAPDWRWLQERADTPWYPTLRLFRPPAPRDWASVSSEVARALRRL